MKLNTHIAKERCTTFHAKIFPFSPRDVAQRTLQCISLILRFLEGRLEKSRLENIFRRRNQPQTDTVHRIATFFFISDQLWTDDTVKEIVFSSPHRFVWMTLLEILLSYEHRTVSMYKHPIAKERSSIFHRENIPFSALPPPTLSRIRSESVSLGSLLKKSRLDVRIVVPLSTPTESVAQNNTSSSSRRVKRPEKLAIVVDRLGVTRRVSANGAENFESPPAAADQLNYELCTDIFTKARSKVAGSVIIHSFFFRDRRLKLVR